MGKTQINFRIEESLLEAIKEAAGKNKTPYTQWIIESCQSRLGIVPGDSLDVDQLIKDAIAPVVDRIDALEEKFNDFSQNTPSRMPYNAQSEGITANHPGSTIEGVKEAESEVIDSPIAQIDLIKWVEDKFGYRVDSGGVSKWAKQGYFPGKGKNKRLSEFFEIRDGEYYFKQNVGD